METVLLGLVALACPLGMGLMMWFMARGMKRTDRPHPAEARSSVEELRAQQRRLAAEIDGVEAKDREHTRVAGTRS